MLPEQFPEHLPRSPLTLVVGQVRFAPILDIHEMIPQIQHRLRDLELPGYEEQRIQQLSIGPKIETDEVRRYVFGGKLKTEAVFLTDRFVVLAISMHDRFKTFSSRLQDILDVVFEVAQPKYVEQTGLRYVNLLKELDEMTSDQMVVPALRGLTTEKLGCVSTRSNSTIQAKTEHGQLTIRCLQLWGPAFLPPDLQIENMEFPNRPEEGEEFRLLDIDHVSSGVAIELEDVQASMDSLHEFVRLGFLRSVTDQAISLWGKS